VAAVGVHLVDASYFVFRAYYAMPTTLADRDGRPVNALYGFARFLSDLLESTQAEFVAVAFDASLESSFRNRLYPPYKANREPAPVELKEQFARCRELCRHLGLVEYASHEYEADDIIGTLAARARATGLRSVLISRDKDLAQLIRQGDEFWDFAGNERFGYEDIAARFGVVPERMADFQALMGDSVDNVPGVPGVGRKTAQVLLTHFDSLESLYADLPAVAALPLRGTTGLIARLGAHRDSAFLARELTRISCDMTLEAQPESLRRRAPDLPALEQFYDEARFGPALRQQAQRIGRAVAAAA
jgi:DNA polymerase-1